MDATTLAAIIVIAASIITCLTKYEAAKTNLRALGRFAVIDR